MYDVTKTVQKAGGPAVVLGLVETVVGIARAKGVELDRPTVYRVGIALYAAWRGFRNWLKNRRRG